MTSTLIAVPGLSWSRRVVGSLGDLLITAGLVLVLFVGWQLWWTDVTSDADAAQQVTVMQAQFDNHTSGVQPKHVKLGDSFAIVRVPRFGARFARPIYEGTDQDMLGRGVGHYVGTADPGEVGNFGLAGHRTTYGRPFNRIAELAAGDVVLVETRSTWFVYRVTGHEIVPPSQVSVLWPVPNQPGVKATEATLTMTSCHPEFSARERYVVHATLEGSYSHSEGVPADELKTGE